jgi:SAM-dependent methyltransferase
MDVRAMYQRRFDPERSFRQQMWNVLCREVFQRHIPERGAVLELGAGYCEFINHIRAGRKIALDVNPELPQHAGPGVECLVSGSEDIPSLPDGSMDAVFMSNFLEHLTRESILRTIREVHRVLGPAGKVLILQPNIRYCADNYWMFFDHITPIDDRALVEVLETNRFRVLLNIPRFLPYTTKGPLPKSIFLMRAYLRLPPVWRLFGGQAFLVGAKTDRSDT